MQRWAARLGAGVLALAGQAAMAQGALELSDAWVRALPPGQPATAAYLVVHNTGSEPVTVEAASASGAGRVEMHDTLQEDGMSRMRQRHQVTVPAGDVLRFQPGGLHLMLLELEAMPPEGETVRLCLHSSEREHCIDAPVRRQAGVGHDHHGHH
ncbi:MAG: hypothetical protein CME38_09080 [Haliea sp.]|nr:hypothetical protein [Haliea sp.]